MQGAIWVSYTVLWQLLFNNHLNTLYTYSYYITCVLHIYVIKKNYVAYPIMYFYTPPHNSGGVLWFHFGRPCVYPSVVCLYFPFWRIIWVNTSGFSANLVCALILWRSGFGLLMGKFHQFLTIVCLPHDTTMYYGPTFFFFFFTCFWDFFIFTSSIYHMYMCSKMYQNGRLKILFMCGKWFNP